MEKYREEYSKEHQKMIIDSLMNDSDEKVISTLLYFKESYNLFIIEPLLDLLLMDRSEVLKKNIVNFISDVKENAAIPLLVNHLKKSFPQKQVNDILTICWQSRLDFSNELEIFFEILQKGNYQAAFEAFTVIENSLENLSLKEIDDHLTSLKKDLAHSNRDKQLLILEMVSLLNKAKREA
jgi:hypothetical protein